MVFNFFVLLIYISLYSNKLLLIFSKGRITGSFESKLGNYPYIKKLNNKDYIALDVNGIYIIDACFVRIENTIVKSTFASYNPHSANIAQFPKEDGNVIIIINHNVLYLISEEEELLGSKEINSLNPNILYSIIPYKRETFGANLCYDFFLLYYDTDKKLKSLPIRFAANTIVEGDPSELNLDFEENDFFNIACSLMETENRKVISCFHGNDYNYIVSTFDILLDNTLQLLGSKSKVFQVGNVNERYIFKTRVLPGNQKAVFCSYSQDDNFDCALYDISTNSFSNYINTNIKGSEFNEQNIFIEYFEQSQKILIGKQINKNILSIIECTEELECGSKIEQTLSCIDNYISRVSIILPMNLAKDIT